MRGDGMTNRVTILYDNVSFMKDSIADWGFACLVESQGRRILFDTGAKGNVLLHNMNLLGIHPSTIDTVFISHAHWDHTGGLSTFLTHHNDVSVYVPPSFSGTLQARETIVVTHETALGKNLYSTGELSHIEQSLIVTTKRGSLVIAGCSHSGVTQILRAAAPFGHVHALIGGLHGFSDFGALKEIDIICATHCTQHVKEIKRLYPRQFIDGGVGRQIEFN